LISLNKCNSVLTLFLRVTVVVTRSSNPLILAAMTGPSLPLTKICSLTFPSPGVLLVTLTRTKELNTIPTDGHWELERVWNWMDENPDIRVGVFTGSGRAFCTGADLRGKWYPVIVLLYTRLIKIFAGWKEIPTELQGLLPLTGFCGVSQRHGKKPILAAVDGLAVGGGMEVLINCDMVICSPKSIFCLPDVKVGLSLLGGTIPLLVKKIGRSRASDMIFTGRNVSSSEAKDWGLVDHVVDEPVKEAIRIAEVISGNGPDAVWASREGIFMALGEGDSFELGRRWKDKYWPQLRDGDDVNEGLSAFLERRRPVWGRENKL